MSNFFSNLATALTRLVRKPDWRVDCIEQGRYGHVYYREAAGVISFYWEFGGGDTVACLAKAHDRVTDAPCITLVP